MSAPTANTAAPVSAPITDTPEFKQALTEAEAKLEAKFMAMAEEFSKKVQAATSQVASPIGTDLTAILSTLALEIGKVSDQGTDRKRVAPEELTARAAAFERMGSLLTIAQAKPQSEWPRYKLVAKVLLNDRVIDPIRRMPNNEIQQVEILHRSIPSPAMRPVNESALAIYREYVRYLGGSQEANSIAPASPLWMTMKGTVLANPATASARGHGAEFSPDPIIVDGEDISTPPGGKSSPETLELLSLNDPRRTTVPVLGTIAEPARTGETSSRAL